MTPREELAAVLLNAERAAYGHPHHPENKLKGAFPSLWKGAIAQADALLVRYNVTPFADQAAAVREPGGKMVEVRVAVAVGSDGDWLACGASGSDDAESISETAHSLGARVQSMSILTARLPIPQPAIVAAKVEGGE